MRTSGAASETNMTIVVMVIAFALLVLVCRGTTGIPARLAGRNHERGKLPVRRVSVPQGLNRPTVSPGSNTRHCTPAGRLGVNDVNARRRCCASVSLAAKKPTVSSETATFPAIFHSPTSRQLAREDWRKDAFVHGDRPHAVLAHQPIDRFTVEPALALQQGDVGRGQTHHVDDARRREPAHRTDVVQRDRLLGIRAAEEPRHLVLLLIDVAHRAGCHRQR